MYFSLKTVAGTPYLCLMQSTYVRGKHPKKTMIKRLGKLSELPQKLQEMIESDDKEMKAELVRRLEKLHPDEMKQALTDAVKETVEQAGDAQQPSDDERSINFNKAQLLRYGHLLFKKIWDDDLNLQYKINYLQRTKTDISTWKLNDLLFYLAARKIIDPASYLDSHNHKAGFLYCPWEQIAQDNFYRGLDYLYAFREELLTHAVKSHLKNHRSEIKVALFDCTNTWFETPYDDLTWKIIRLRRETADNLSRKGFTEKQIEDYFESDEFNQLLQSELELTKDDIIRMRGKSKEGRCAQPLIMVALAIDQTGFPIDCRIFAGNMSELKTISPMLESLKDKYNLQNNDVYFTADRGLNSTASLNEIHRQGLGYVVAQKVSNQKEQYRKEMLDLNGYRKLKYQNGTLVPSDEPADSLDCARYKICDYQKVQYVPCSDGSVTESGRPRRQKLIVKNRIIYTYTPERRARDEAELDNAVVRASHAVSDGMLMGNNFGTGWRSLIKTKKEAAENKEDKELYRAVGLKQDVIKARRDIAGYYAVVFDHPAGCAPDKVLSEEEILTTYHRLVGIEDCFKIMKSRFSIRPVYVRLKKRIIAHCYLCVLALMMLKELQFKLEAQGEDMSVPSMMTALQWAGVFATGDGTYAGTELTNMCGAEGFYKPEYTGKKRIEQGLNQLDGDEAVETYLSEREKHADDIDTLLKAAGLNPLPLKCRLPELKRAFGLQSVPDERMIAKVNMAYMQRAHEVYSKKQ